MGHAFIHAPKAKRLLCGKGISRIKRIETPGFPAPCILVPLNALLLGKLPLEMPSPEDISFVEVQYIYFNRAMYVKIIFTHVRKRMDRTDRKHS